MRINCFVTILVTDILQCKINIKQSSNGFDRNLFCARRIFRWILARADLGNCYEAR